ncbi:olfactory receptor-like protein COR4 [Anomaloglossus baeobatrachus]
MDRSERSGEDLYGGVSYKKGLTSVIANKGFYTKYSSLKTPMYFFLCNLSFLDIVYTSVTSPKLIHIFVTNDGRISFLECTVQLFFFDAFWNTEYLILTVMSYDRYVAISLEKVAIGNDSYIRNAIFIHGSLFVATSFIFTLISYIFIITTVLKIRTKNGRYKAFSTCASHLSIVSLFYTLLFGLYFSPKSIVSQNQGKILTVLYVYIIPLLNPVVYSFRNRDVKEACRKILIK